MRHSRTIGLAGVFLGVSALLYAGLWALFPDRLVDIGFYTLLDIAFIPVSALIFSLVVDRLLAQREREALLHKLNMVVGAFFSEVGTEAIGRMLAFDADVERVRPHLLFDGAWTAQRFAEARRAVVDHERGVDVDLCGMEGLRDFLVGRRPFMLRLLENQNMLEHEGFTDMLWALFHLTEELAARGDLSALATSDREHVELDLARAYGRLLAEWLGYVEHLKADYPFLYSFAVRTNPFDPDADIGVKG